MSTPNGQIAASPAPAAPPAAGPKRPRIAIAPNGSQPTIGKGPRRSLASLFSSEDRAHGDSVCLVGGVKLGKTSFAFGAPSPVFIFPDRMGDEVLPRSFKHKIKPDAWDDLPGVHEAGITVMGALRSLRDEPHEYRTVVIDTINRGQLLLWKWICAKYQVASIKDGDLAWGAGYVNALEQMDEMLTILFDLASKRGMNWIIISHQESKTEKNPAAEEYEKWVLQLHQKSAGAILGAVNTVMFAEPVLESKALGKGTADRPAKRVGRRTGVTRAVVRAKQGMDAGSRHLLPAEMILSWAVYEQERAKGDELREQLSRYLATLDTAGRAQVDDYMSKYGWSREAHEAILSSVGGQIPKEAPQPAQIQQEEQTEETDEEEEEQS